MRFEKYFFTAAAFGLSCVLTAGCGAPAAKPTDQAKQESAAPAATSVAVAADKSSDVPESFKELSPADRELALKQKVCPVTGEKLGSMGTPVKVEVKGRTVFLCCAGCVEEIKKDPDKYLAKLDAAK